MSDTPRTTFRRIPVDATQALVPADCYTVMADHAEALERELAAMTAAKNKAVEAYKRLVQAARDNGCLYLFDEAHDKLITELTLVK